MSDSVVLLRQDEPIQNDCMDENESSKGPKTEITEKLCCHNQITAAIEMVHQTFGVTRK